MLYRGFVRHTPIAPWRQADAADFGTGWQGSALKLLADKALKELPQPLLNSLCVVFALKAINRQVKDLGGVSPGAQKVIKEKVM
jgi:hypothetical protein